MTLVLTLVCQHSLQEFPGRLLLLLTRGFVGWLEGVGGVVVLARVSGGHSHLLGCGQKQRERRRLPSDCRNPGTENILLTAGLSEQTWEAGTAASVSSEG